VRESIRVRAHSRNKREIISKGFMRFSFKEKEKHMQDNFRNPTHV
jgi:hypothetical protein